MRFWLVPLLLLLLCFDVPAEEMPNCSSVKNDDLYALACNIYWEGRNQSVRGMLSIATVTLNRVEDPAFPNTPAKVVWEKNWSKKRQRWVAQFSWTLDGKRDKPYKSEQREWEWAMSIAHMFTVDRSQKASMCPEIASTRRMWDILEKQGSPVKRRPVGCKAYDEFMESTYELASHIDPTHGSTFYHADYVKPYWRKAFERVIKVGTHIFYRKKDRPA